MHTCGSEIHPHKALPLAGRIEFLTSASSKLYETSVWPNQLQPLEMTKNRSLQKVTVIIKLVKLKARNVPPLVIKV